VFPNPSNGELHLSMANPRSLDWACFGMNGELLKEGHWNASSAEAVDLTEMPAGMYVLRLTAEDKVAHVQVAVVR
jgi:Secretion system C-terminal sorting domain